METHEAEMSDAEAAALLAWYRAVGVDELVGESPRNWFASEETISPALNAPSATPTAGVIRDLSHNSPIDAAQRQTGSGVTQLTDARELVRSAANLGELRGLLEGFDGCPLNKTAKNLCLSRGSANARLMLIGEAPGKEEDEAGIPFVGRAGQLLDRMLAAIGLGAKDVYITNLVFWRPPGNRTPSPEEAQICQPFVERQIELVAPDILVFLGGAAAKQLTGSSDGILKLRGKWLSYTAHGTQPTIRAMATLHPAYLLRTPIAKRLAWRDLLLIREALDAAR